MKLTAYLFVLATFIYMGISCSKTGGFPPPPPPDPCLSINLGLSGTVSNPSIPGAADGSINVTASGGTGFTFCINGGPYQSSNRFNNLAAGNYTVTCRNAEGCMASVSFTLTNPVISCSGVNINVALAATLNVPCESPSATVTVNATGGTAPYTYSLDGGAFQPANTFYAVPTGNCSITVKDMNGCTGTASTTVNNAVAGPLFNQVRALIILHCQYCHGNSNPAGGVKYVDACDIVNGKDRILARAVNGQPSPMPSTGLLPASERQKITNWINAGGRFSD